MEIFKLKKLNDVEFKEQHQLKVSNRSAALENLMRMRMMMVMWASKGLRKILESLEL
jgi:hypothetical protein